MITEQDYKNLAKKARELKATNAHGLKEVLFQILWLCTGVVLSLLPECWILGQIILGIGFWRSFAILHACGHNALFKSTLANHVVGFMMSPFSLIPYASWKSIHQDHHIWTGWKDLDPTTKGTLKALPAWKGDALNFCWRFWLPVISIHYIFGLFYNPFHSSIRKSGMGKWYVFLSILWISTFHLAIGFFYPREWLMIFPLSFFIYLNLGDLSLLTQHVHLPLDQSEGKTVGPKPLWQQEQYSHTLVLPTWVEKWFILGFNHHALHHLFPRLPYYLTREISFHGEHTQDWKEWIGEAKRMKATELIFSE